MEVKYIEISESTPDYLISIDIGYSSTGICIYNFKKRTLSTYTPKLKKFLEDLNTKNLGIPEYVILSQRIVHFIALTIKDLIGYSPKTKIAYSFEVPNIVGNYAPALSILLNNFILYFSRNCRATRIFLTHNRLGGFYLKRRSFSKGDIKELLNKLFPKNTFKNEHERDSFLACYTVLCLAYDINLNKNMRSLEDSTLKELKL